MFRASAVIFDVRRPRLLVLVLAAASVLSAQVPNSLITSGQVDHEGQFISFEVRHLPVSSFPNLPLDVAGQLTDRGCLIPQTYEARRPENVVHASFQQPGSSDWAVLCSTDGTVKLMIFFGSTPGAPLTLATSPETQRLQTHYGTRVLGFNWGIDPATPDAIRQAQIGMSPRPARLDHDALADSAVDKKTIYRFYAKGSWSVLDMPVE